MNTHPNLLESDNSVLVVIDLQTKLSAVMPPEMASVTTTNTIRLIDAANKLDIPMLVTEQYPPGLGATEERICNSFSLSTPIFDKTGFSCCASEDFCYALQTSERKQIILVGQETHVCVLQTALELLQRGHQVFVVADAVSSRNSEHKINALQRMQQQGVTVTNYESVLFEWLRNASHPQFKAISALLR
jgi:nicotinamidase-related amidase